MYYVSWYEAVEFCNKLSQMEGLMPYYTINKEQPDSNNSNAKDTLKWQVTPNETANGYRLPTEVQWEYAAKGGNKGETFTYAGSDTIGDVAWYIGNNGASGEDNYGCKPVGTKAPNCLGLYDISGNVHEWCWDWYDAPSGSYHIVRGGGWHNSAESVRLEFRDYGYPNSLNYGLGFRIVLPWFNG